MLWYVNHQLDEVIALEIKINNLSLSRQRIFIKLNTCTIFVNKPIYKTITYAQFINSTVLLYYYLFPGVFWQRDIQNFKKPMCTRTVIPSLINHIASYCTSGYIKSSIWSVWNWNSVSLQNWINGLPKVHNVMALRAKKRGEIKIV